MVNLKLNFKRIGLFVLIFTLYYTCLPSAHAVTTIDPTITPIKNIILDTPTTRADKKTPLGLSEIERIDLWCKQAEIPYDTKATQNNITLPQSKIPLDLTQFQSGKVTCYAVITDIDGRDSVPSGEISELIFYVGKPAPATNLRWE